MWLSGRLTPDFKTIADFKDNGPAIRETCRQFIALCRQLGRVLRRNVDPHMGAPGHFGIYAFHFPFRKLATPALRDTALARRAAEESLLCLFV
jgi:hypothetical protein